MQCTSCVSSIGPRLPEQHDPECGPVPAGRSLADGADVYLCRKNNRSRNMHKLSGVMRIVIVSIQPHRHPSVITSKRPHASNQFQVGTVDSAPSLQTITACTRGSPTSFIYYPRGSSFRRLPQGGPMTVSALCTPKERQSFGKLHNKATTSVESHS
ncbi:hypothetical protein GY45DRAFT_1332071, partial [Cubamyces sp. BRFM 1775]